MEPGKQLTRRTDTPATASSKPSSTGFKASAAGIPAKGARGGRKPAGTKSAARSAGGNAVTVPAASATQASPATAASGVATKGAASKPVTRPAVRRKVAVVKVPASKVPAPTPRQQAAAPARPAAGVKHAVVDGGTNTTPSFTRRGPLPGVGSTLGGLLQFDAESAGNESGSAPTQRQMEIYAFIREKIHSRGFGPTVREIGQAFHIRSPNGVVCHLKALERKRLITRGRNMSRAIELVAEPAHLKGLPMAGWVAAGSLRVADEQQERIDFQELFDRDDHFVLKVMGDSMIEAQISDGDWVVIRRQKTARAGDIVVAQTDDGEATLKQWFPERDRIRLQPANATMKPIFVKNARVLGVLVGVVRKTS